MRKSMMLAGVFAVAAGVLLGSVALAEESAETAVSDVKDGKGMMMGRKGMMGKGMMGGMVMKGMMAKTVTATEDGGVVVLSGNQLMKYDKNLTLINQVEIPVNMESMKKGMADMMKMCPMMGEGDKSDENEGVAVKKDGEDHAAHH